MYMYQEAYYAHAFISILELGDCHSLGINAEVFI